MRKTQENQENKENIVITINREYGSGGRQIAQSLANSLGLDYYDRSIIEMTAKQSNLSETYIEAKEQTMTNSFLYDLFSQYQALTEQETQLDKLYEIETNVIKETASKGNCIIVGRCSDFILKDMQNCHHIFLYASEEFKVQQIMQRDQLKESAAQKQVRDINKKRFAHYKYYTGRMWGLSKYYDLCLDVSALGIDKSVEIITQYITLAQ